MHSRLVSSIFQGFPVEFLHWHLVNTTWCAVRIVVEDVSSSMALNLFKQLDMLLAMYWSKFGVFAQGANNAVVEFVLICALKSLLLWIICVQCENPLSAGLEFVRRYAQSYLLFWSFLCMEIFCVRTQIFLPTLDCLHTQASTLGHGCIMCMYADIPINCYWHSNTGLFANMSKCLR